MRVAVVYWDSKEKGLNEIAASVAGAVEKQGHQVKIFNGMKDDFRLSIYDYILLGTIAESPMGKDLHKRISSSMALAGSVTGKRCFAFVKKSGFRSYRILQQLMLLMEAEGMIVRNSAIFKDEEEAKIFGSRLIIKK